MTWANKSTVEHDVSTLTITADQPKGWSSKLEGEIPSRTFLDEVAKPIKFLPPKVLQFRNVPNKDRPITTSKFLNEQTSDPHSREVESPVGELGISYSYGRYGIVIWQSRIDGALQKFVLTRRPGSILWLLRYFVFLVTQNEGDFTTRCNTSFTGHRWAIESLYDGSGLSDLHCAGHRNQLSKVPTSLFRFGTPDFWL